MVPARNKAKCISLLNHTTKTINHHHYHLRPVNTLAAEGCFETVPVMHSSNHIFRSE